MNHMVGRRESDRERAGRFLHLPLRGSLGKYRAVDMGAGCELQLGTDLKEHNHSLVGFPHANLWGYPECGRLARMSIKDEASGVFSSRGRRRQFLGRKLNSDRPLSTNGIQDLRNNRACICNNSMLVAKESTRCAEHTLGGCRTSGIYSQFSK